MVTIKVKNIKFTLLLSLALVAVFAFKPGNGKGKVGTIKTIVIDAGHGGKDPGCNGVSSKEKDVSLSVALKLGKLIEENMKDVKVIYTRTTDVFVDLEDRAQIANKAKADLFISIHCNAAGKVVKYRDPKTKKMR
ncbi:MAG: N-acetylmuramoyl-L-alanine amidase [Sphingobacteriaceae bacterium]|nr:N-acetylmuramoyl-L-alanine amidase [Sphingobacteriaceae bacterium]